MKPEPKIQHMENRKEHPEPSALGGEVVQEELRSALEASKQCCEERFRSVVRAARDAVICIDGRGRILFWNRGAEEIFGYSESEAVGQKLTLIIPERMHAAHLDAMERAVSSRFSDIRTTEVRGLTKGGDEVPLELSLSSWHAKDGLFFTGILRDVTERMEMQESLRRANAELEMRVRERTRELARANDALQAEMKGRKSLETKILEISAAEQRRIGRDLHDVLGQHLTGIVFMADLLKEKLRAKELPEAADAARLRGFLEEAISQVRALARGLCPVDMAAGDLGEGLKEFVGSVTYNRGVDCSFECDCPDALLNDTFALHIYHIAQEAVNNAMRHGKARKILTRLNESEGRIELEIIDDGKGIPEEAHRGKGLGLHIMRYRAGVLGGTMEVARIPGGGTRVRCSVPIRNREIEEGGELDGI